MGWQFGGRHVSGARQESARRDAQRCHRLIGPLRRQGLASGGGGVGTDRIMPTRFVRPRGRLAPILRSWHIQHALAAARKDDNPVHVHADSPAVRQPAT